MHITLSLARTRTCTLGALETNCLPPSPLHLLSYLFCLHNTLLADRRLLEFVVAYYPVHASITLFMFLAALLLAAFVCYQLYLMSQVCSDREGPSR